MNQNTTNLDFHTGTGYLSQRAASGPKGPRGALPALACCCCCCCVATLTFGLVSLREFGVLRGLSRRLRIAGLVGAASVLPFCGVAHLSPRLLSSCDRGGAEARVGGHAVGAPHAAMAMRTGLWARTAAHTRTHAHTGV